MVFTLEISGSCCWASSKSSVVIAATHSVKASIATLLEFSSSHCSATPAIVGNTNSAGHPRILSGSSISEPGNALAKVLPSARLLLDKPDVVIDEHIRSHLDSPT